MYIIKIGLYWGSIGTCQFKNNSLNGNTTRYTPDILYGKGDIIKFELLLDKNPNFVRIYKNGSEIHNIEIVEKEKWYLAVALSYGNEYQYKIIDYTV